MSTARVVIDPLLAAVGAGVVLATLGALTAGVRWAIEQGLGQVLSDLRDTCERIEQQQAAHDRRHTYERRQLIAALNRQGVEPPDGWHQAPPAV